ncbi:MAG TPA: ATP-binding protein [Deferrisomatales bacterium]|nr:ATP-binding protein [Deferrisomatales bacterium]
MSKSSPLQRQLERIAAALERQGTPGPETTAPPPGRALLWQGAAGFRAVRRLDAVDPNLLVGLERQKTLLFDNVRRFVAGAPAHDVLLWGDRGTGKSTLVRSLLIAVDEPSLALLAVAEAHLSDLPRILDLLEADPRRWLMFCDDLSFGNTGERYKEFKVLLEGGLEARPANTLLVATSNRRHLVPESFATTGEIHPEETVAEEISLADRFGLSLGFYPFNQTQYLEAVERHLAALGCAPCPPEWQTEALRWSMARGIRSGRSALQAARDLAGRHSQP